MKMQSDYEQVRSVLREHSCPDGRSAPGMCHRCDADAALERLRQREERVTTILVEVKEEISRNFECHREDEQDESGHCSGDECLRCWMDLMIQNANETPEAPGRNCQASASELSGKGGGA